ncbi:MAG TPA: nitrite/sulfite reductase [Candidatus Binatia bacterium]|nr:nitrite/sulfite reductase [Candidatus Binatia bacterium]
MVPTDAELRAAMRAHGERVDRYRRGELTDDQFRPIRLSYGLYYQLDHTSHMQRIKLPGGLMTAAQADCLADITDDYGRGIAHVTTRQDLQIHWVDIAKIMEMYERLHAAGITTRGACADSVRNVTGCIHAGTWPTEPFDVTPYLLAAHDYFLFHPLNLTQPRKFKIAFSGCDTDCAQGPINDLAFFAHVRDGQRGFAVYAGGGLAAQPYLAQKIWDFIPAENTLLAAETVVRFQHRYGERKNRHKARLKYVFKKWGVPKVLEELQREYDRVEAQMGDRLRRELSESAAAARQPEPTNPPASLTPSNDAAFTHWCRTNTYAQRQGGYFGCTGQLPLGDISGAQLRALANLSRQHGNGVLRASNDQNILIPWVAGDHVRAVYDQLTELGLAAPDALHITDVTSCPGADYCSLAMSRSMGVAATIQEHLLATNGEVEKLGVFRVKISGCPNSCGQHHVGDIGLTGMTLKGDDGHDHPHYSILVGGSIGERTAAIGHRVTGRFPVDETPKVVAALAAFYQRERTRGERFPDFVQRVGMPRINDVARSAARVVH